MDEGTGRDRDVLTDGLNYTRTTSSEGLLHQKPGYELSSLSRSFYRPSDMVRLPVVHVSECQENGRSLSGTLS